jgi:uncharacterized protein
MRKPAETRPMTTVQELHVYPVKSCRGIARQTVKVGATGFEWDRQWMVIDATDTFITQRTHPKLATIDPGLSADALVLSAEGAGSVSVPFGHEGPPVTVRVWNDVCVATDQGDEASDWLSAALGDAVRLVRVGAQMDRKANPQYAGPDPAPVTFVDGYPVLVCNRASLDDLNARMPEPIPMARFRPNLVLEGLVPFAEDRIAALRIGDVTLRLVKPSVRCIITSTDQRSGERSTNPLPVLRKFRFSRELMGVTFGENAVIAAGVGGTIALGARCAARMDDTVSSVGALST